MPCSPSRARRRRRTRALRRDLERRAPTLGRAISTCAPRARWRRSSRRWASSRSTSCSPSMLLGWRAEMRPLELSAWSHAARESVPARASTRRYRGISAPARRRGDARCDALGGAGVQRYTYAGIRGARAPRARARPRAAASEGRPRARVSLHGARGAAARACAPRSCSAALVLAAVASARRARRPRRSATSTSPAPESGAAIAAIAASLIGTPYEFGGADLAGFDCSGLALYVHERVGISIPRTAAAQQRAAQAVPLTQLRPGTWFFSAWHPAASTMWASTSAAAASCTRRIAVLRSRPRI